ncbi:MAG: Na+/H+ antiporter NhaA [Acidimicrobiales bacterium]
MSGPDVARAEVPIDRLRAPLLRLIHLENLSGLALIAGAVTALVLANTPLHDSVDHFWHQHLVVRVGAISLDESLLHWVNDGLMTLFFFVAGLEIKRELVAGDLRDPRKAALPALAAAGGMIVPALAYLLLADSATRGGWGIPMATDIAFAIGVLTLLGKRVPGRLKVFLLTLAIVDDLGAIVVIAVVYTASLNTTALMVAGMLLVALIALRVLGVWWMPIYVLTGVALWLAVFESGIHATVAGVVCGLMAPAKPRRPDQTEVRATNTDTIDELKAIIFDTRETKSVADRLIHNLHPFVALLIVPVFALANTSVVLSPEALTGTATSAAGQAVFVGLVVGKPLGILGASWLAVRSKIATLPTGTTWPHILGVGFLGGIGFTVSLFITDLAFDTPAAVDTGKISVLVASVSASALGAAILIRSGNPAGSQPVDPTDLPPISYEELDATSPLQSIASAAMNGSSSPETSEARQR